MRGSYGMTQPPAPTAPVGGTTTHRSALFSAQRPATKKSAPGGGAANANAQSEEAIERENDAILNALADDTARLRRAAGHLVEDVKEHNVFLDQLTGGFYRATDGVRGTIGRLDQTMQRYGWRHTVYVAFGIFLFCVVAYYLVTFVLRRNAAAQEAALTAGPK